MMSSKYDSFAYILLFLSPISYTKTADAVTRGSAIANKLATEPKAMTPLDSSEGSATNSGA